jgi:stage IV sporulation protein FB
MRDPYTWSFPIGQIAGIIIRVHILMPLILGGFILREAFRDSKEFIPGAWIDASILMILLFLIVLLHELGHCLAARLTGGDAREVVLWPLGGLASVETPHTPSAHFLVAVGGPLVNAAICLGAALLLAFAFEPSWQPPWNPLAWAPYRDEHGKLLLHDWTGVEHSVLYNEAVLPLLLARLFYVSWIMLLVNVLLVGLPLDGGRMLQASLWPHFGYRQSMQYAIFTGFGVMLFVILVALVWNQVLIILLGAYIYLACKHEWLALSDGEDSLFGYDFSQGYTSLEKEAAPASQPKKQMNFLQRWLQRRAQRRIQREHEQRESEEKRMDELLQKIAEHGKESLTDEETRFLKRVADRYRNRRP